MVQLCKTRKWAEPDSVGQARSERMKLQIKIPEACFQKMFKDMW